MNILYISQYFPPEVGATQTRAYEMATNLVRQGHKVTVMTEVPNHPSGIVSPGYRNRLWVKEEMDGVDVIRSLVYATPIKTFRTRMLFYLSFMVTTVFNSLFINQGKFDAVYATSPPLFVGLAGLIIAKLRRIPFIFEVRDLWPESAVELGQVANPRHIRYGYAIANLCYRHAKGIVGVTHGICDTLKSKGLPEHKLFLIKNGTNPKRYRFILDRALEERLGWEGKFVVLYAGIHGVAQGLETVLEAAKLLKNENKIHFAFIGDGPTKARLIAKANEERLSNVEFLPEVPSNEIARHISLAGVCLVLLRKKKLFEGALPSKVFDCWACGKPLLLGVDGEARKELESARGGLYVEPENALAIARGVLDMYQNPDKAKEMGENGRRYIYENGYIRDHQALYLAKTLDRLTAKPALEVKDLPRIEEPVPWKPN
jgi:glycosyltransferase involved in cell wall biosynthesis